MIEIKHRYTNNVLFACEAKNMKETVLTAIKRAVARNNFILMAMCGGFGYLVVLGLLDTFNGVM